MPRFDILSVGVDAVTPEEALETAMGFLESGGPCRVLATPNPEMIMLANKDEGFLKILKNAELVVPDGAGVVLASRLLRRGIKRRVTGCDLLQALFKKISDENTGHTAYLFGAKPGVAEKAAERLSETYPSLRIIGCGHGFQSAAEEAAMEEEITGLAPDVLVIGLSMGMSEKWADSHRHLPVRLMACTGGTIDILAGNVKRAPVVFQKCGAEWLWRLMKQPRRAVRMLALPAFAAKVTALKIRQMRGRG